MRRTGIRPKGFFQNLSGLDFMELLKLEQDLDWFDPQTRRRALEIIAGELKEGRLQAPTQTGKVNVHLHTFFSFNACGYSPSRIAWEARKMGLDVAGSVDFDVLDAMEEFYSAGDLLELRTVAALETRVFMPEYADREINSPGEPGVSYFMGTGFTAFPPEWSPAGICLSKMRRTARARNEAMLESLNSYLPLIRIDYEQDVLPLTPSGNATERHILAALDARSRERFPEENHLAQFWSEALGILAEDMKVILKEPAKFRNTIRARLMKKGGVGYRKPDRSTFPPIHEVIRMVQDSGAIPCATWLDGTSSGEEDAGAILDDYRELGCLALNIIPDRNWNIAKTAEKEVKTVKLREIVGEARKRHLIFSVGTEMNNYGQKFVDTFEAPDMAPYAQDFRNGAYILYGHAILQRFLRKGRTSIWASTVFGENCREANEFYLEVGQRAFPPLVARERLANLESAADPASILRALS